MKTNAIVMEPRALNRALLARQHLLERVPMPALAMVEHLVGMQAQLPTNPYTALCSRIAAFDPETLSADVNERRAVRLALMRSTIHLVSARDALTLRPLVQPVIERSTNGAFGRRLAGIYRDALAAAGRALVEATPRTLNEIGTALGTDFPERDPQALANGIRALVPLVQVPPRGTWRGVGQATHTSAEHWLGKSLDANPSIDDVVFRYLAAFGPASVNDAQNWSGLTRLRAAFERLRPQLITFRDETDRELFDVPDAPRPDADTPAPPRFLPDYDNVVLGHADRTRIVSALAKSAIGVPNGSLATLLIDGSVAGVWRADRTRTTTTLTVETLEPVPRAHRKPVRDEAERLAAFIAGPGNAPSVTMVTR